VQSSRRLEREALTEAARKMDVTPPVTQRQHALGAHRRVKLKAPKS
jgi:hypothetical protein